MTSLVWLLAACSGSDAGVSVHNLDPEVEITSPVEGQVLHASDTVTFAALIGDDLTANDDLGIAWGSTLQGPLEGEGSVNDIGALLQVEALDAGEHTVILQVVDSSGGSAEDRVDFTVEANAPPTVDIVAPEAGDASGLGLSVHVQIQVADDYLVDLTEIALAWSGLEDLSGAPDHPNADGSADFFLDDLDLGTYSLHVNATDPAGDAGSASVSFEVVEPDIDGDGFLDATLGGTDCNDGDAAIHPDADERCDGVDNDCDGDTDEGDAVDAELYYSDADGDGFGDEDQPTTACAQPTDHIAEGGDCDDEDPAVNPDASEVCDGLDNDCDGAADENDAIDVTTWYEDADGDGYGTAAVAQVSCEASPGFVADGTDCDDGNAVVNPGQTETCNGVDDDCSGTADDGFDADADGVADCFDVEQCDGLDNDGDGDVDEEATDAGTWYADADGDGYGDPDDSTTACSVPSGYVAGDTDCDDDDATSHPGASEVCDDADNDCNGSIDDNASDTTTWYYDGDGDGYGRTDTTIKDCDQPSRYVADPDDCDDGNASVSPGESETCNGRDDNCDGDTDEDSAIDVTTWYRDDDGDGYGDASVTDIDCDQPGGYVSAGTDCDDGDSSISPGATEYCDGHDDDCDGSTDESDSADATTWYDDTDSDGYGDSAASQRACSQPTGTVTDSSDCDDGDASIHPGADEYCEGLVDEDCDGSVDETSAVDALTWFEDADGDTYGNASSTTPACSEPGGYVADDTDCDDSDATVNPAASETWYDGVDGDCDGGSDYDADGDGYDHSDHGGLDCDDTDAAHYPGATTWTVPGDASSIQDAVDLACTYDTIEVAAGTWTERLDFGDKELFLVGVDGSGATTLDGDFYGDPAITMPGGTLEGFTVTNGLALQGGAIRAEGGDWLELIDVVIDGNYASDRGGGVYASYVDELAFTDVEVQDNLGGSGAGLYLEYPSSVTASNLTVTGNETSGSSTYGGGLYLYANSATVDMPGIVLTGNSAYYGAGAYLQGSTLTADLSGAEITGNHATYRSGAVDLYVYSNSTVDLSGSELSRNQADQYYGVGYFQVSSTSELNLAGSLMDDNQSSGHYGIGEFYASSTSVIDLTGVSMQGNSSLSSYTLLVGSSSSSTVDLTDLVLSKNSSGSSYSGGYLWASSSSEIVLDGAEISSNRGGSSYPGLYLSISDSSEVTAAGLTVLDNQTSGSSTAALHVYTYSGGTFEADNLLVAGNSGPGVQLDTTSTSDLVALTNATIAGNGGTGLTLEPVWVRQVDLVNVISAYNEGYGLSNDSSTYEPELVYSNVYGNDSGEYDGLDDPTGADGNLSVDPEFLVFSPDSDPALWDLHLAAGSPLEDAGHPDLTDPDGSTSDMGAYGGPGGVSGYSDDADGDGMADGWEEAHGLDPSTDDASDDLDGDGLSNGDEFATGSDPEDPWTDQDIWSDGDEVAAGTDPLVTDDSASAWLRGPSGSAAGYSLSMPGDVDGDGVDDLLIGSWSYAWLVHGPITADVDLSTTYDTRFDGSYAGYGVAQVGDLDGDGHAEIVLGAYNVDGSTGAVYLYRGPTGASESTSATDATWTGESSNDHAGRQIAPAGDQDGDGVIDVFISAPYHDEGASNGGAVYLVSGADTGTDTLAAALAKRSHNEENTYAGHYGLAGGMDLDGDGVGDLATGVTYSSVGKSSGGAVFIEHGPISGTGDLTGADVVIAPTGSNDHYFGWGVEPGGDVDGDGNEDLLACMYYEQSYAGGTYVLAGPLTEDATPGKAAMGKLVGEESGDGACAAAAAGDLDGDGYGDLVIGSYENDSAGSNAGAAYVVLGPVTGTLSLSEARVKQTGDDSEDYLGRNVAGGDDLDGDGIPDVVISADYDDTNGSYSGGVAVLLGSGF